MYIQRNKVISKTGKEYRSVLLCSKYREGGKIKTRTEMNLSNLPEMVILSIENALKSDREVMVCLKDISVDTTATTRKARCNCVWACSPRKTVSRYVSRLSRETRQTARP